MEITPQLFDHIAHLSRLRFSDEEKEAIRNDMQKMVSFFEQLNHLDVSGVTPLEFLSGVRQELRDDIPTRSVIQEPAVPQYYTVPKVIENPGS
jgi:aspartyl-tRNA(Asn)/glutamyl-tRNA(Gln) amidotransferase subunit C